MRTFRLVPLIVVAAVSVAFVAAWVSGYHLAINGTYSMPRGLYLVSPLDDVLRGEVVSLCIPNEEAAALYRQRTYLPSSSLCLVGLPPLLKPIVALPGDLVEITASGTLVNGKPLPNSRVFDTDSSGLPIPHLPLGWSKRMASNEYFMLANHTERSLDSRYYGTVHRADLISRARPLITE